jgi:hypothetical protein
LLPPPHDGCGYIDDAVAILFGTPILSVFISHHWHILGFLLRGAFAKQEMTMDHEKSPSGESDRRDFLKKCGKYAVIHASRHHDLAVDRDDLGRNREIVDGQNTRREQGLEARMGQERQELIRSRLLKQEIPEERRGL